MESKETHLHIFFSTITPLLFFELRYSMFCFDYIWNVMAFSGSCHYNFSYVSSWHFSLECTDLIYKPVLTYRYILLAHCARFFQPSRHGPRLIELHSKVVCSLEQTKTIKLMIFWSRVVLVELEGKSPFVIVIVCWAPDPQFFQVFEGEAFF